MAINPSTGLQRGTRYPISQYITHENLIKDVLITLKYLWNKANVIGSTERTERTNNDQAQRPATAQLWRDSFRGTFQRLVTGFGFGFRHSRFYARRLGY